MKVIRVTAEHRLFDGKMSLINKDFPITTVGIRKAINWWKMPRSDSGTMLSSPNWGWVEVIETNEPKFKLGY